MFFYWYLIRAWCPSEKSTDLENHIISSWEAGNLPPLCLVMQEWVALVWKVAVIWHRLQNWNDLLERWPFLRTKEKPVFMLLCKTIHKISSIESDRWQATEIGMLLSDTASTWELQSCNFYFSTILPIEEMVSSERITYASRTQASAYSPVSTSKTFSYSLWYQ